MAIDRPTVSYGETNLALIVRALRHLIDNPETLVTLGAAAALTANRTYYVRSGGSDSNTGLVDTDGGAFLTIQKAVNVAVTLALSGFSLTVQIADGTYAGDITLKNVGGFAAAGDLIIQGNASTPANVVIQGQVSAVGLNTTWRIKDCKIGGSSDSACLFVQEAFLQFTNIDFGSCTVAQLWVNGGGRLEAVGNYAISAGASAHARIDAAGIIVISGRTVTISNTPAFSAATIVTNVGPCCCQCHLMTFSGSATGSRFYADGNSVIYAGGAGASYLPGNSSGVVTMGGQYV